MNLIALARKILLLASAAGAVAYAQVPTTWTSSSTLYGTTNSGGQSHLVEINSSTGALVRTIGTVGFVVNGMTYDRSTGTMYATTSEKSAASPNSLITINLSTGQGTVVGSGAGQNVNVPTADSSGNLYGWTESSDDLVRWNKTTGTITVIASPIGSWEQSFAFDKNDVPYFLNGDAELFTINTSTGTVTSTGFVTGTTYDMAHHGDFNPQDNTLYAIDRTNDYSPANPRNIHVINITTRAVVATLPTVNNLHTLAFIKSSSSAGGGGGSPFPAQSALGLALLALLVTLAGVVVHQRRQHH